MIGLRADLSRPPEGESASRVTFTELFFDLVFVFAVTQVSHLLIHEPNPLGLMHTAMLGVAVWWAWVFTAWVTNWLNPDTSWVRGMLLGLMIIALFMSSALPHAFGDGAVLFAITFALLQVSRSVFTALAFARHRREHAVNMVRISAWLTASGVLWIAGAFLPAAQLWLWLAALAIDLAGPPSRFWVPALGRSPLATWSVTGAHMAERVSLFIIIALGESIIVSGTSFSAQPFDTTAVLAFSSAIVGAVLFWLVYFNHSERAGSRFLSAAAESGAVARIAYTYVPLPMIFGIIVTAVADHAVLTSPGERSAWSAGLVCGGAALYLLGNALFRRATGSRWLVGHLLGVVALAALFAAQSALPLLAVAWLSNAVLLAVVIVEEFTHRRDRKSDGTRNPMHDRMGA